MEIRQNTEFKVPVRLRLTATGAGKTGLVYSQVTVYIQKQGGSSSQLTLSSASQFVEVDATNMPGVYDLLLSSTDTNTTGFLKYTVLATDCDMYYGLVEVVARTKGFTFS